MASICFSCVEVTSIGAHGFWLQFNEEEIYVAFVEFPRFEHATVAQIFRVECAGTSRLYWPALQLDIGLESMRNPFAGRHCAPSHYD